MHKLKTILFNQTIHDSYTNNNPVSLSLIWGTGSKIKKLHRPAWRQTGPHRSFTTCPATAEELHGEKLSEPLSQLNDIFYILCGPLCLLCGSLWNKKVIWLVLVYRKSYTKKNSSNLSSSCGLGCKKNYTELHRGFTELHGEKLSEPQCLLCGSQWN